MTALPAADGFRMPPEWAPHDLTWMAWPSSSITFDDAEDLAASRAAWGAVAKAVARFEPVTMVAAPGDAQGARAQLGGYGVKVVELPLNDAWMRDMGPTFLVGGGQLAAADWTFNGWGGQEWARWDLDAEVGARVAELAGARRYSSKLVNEGGGIHVDGEGTVLLTETVQLDPGRNPGWTREEVEEELHAFLGTSKAIWLPRGLTADYGRFGTRGHVDIVAAFARPGVVVVHSQQDPAHPDHEVSREVIALLRGATDARGRSLEVVELPAPAVTEVDGEPVDYSYVNHYLCNGGVVLCGFDDPADERNAEIFARLFPQREVVLVDAREIFAHGGGIHCITQQQPRV
ncbi:agmatine deiminase family protein [Streptomyces sp. RPT161]|uniref:agmatine deiminase family protein n=1 Tax=Streptomyces sp. RPT161 TaxID=3015993 RepID=UPI0022B8F76C|nr:agmatine deiminase family protein [Streptomyces sp. RPT161]